MDQTQLIHRNNPVKGSKVQTTRDQKSSQGLQIQKQMISQTILGGSSSNDRLSPTNTNQVDVEEYRKYLIGEKSLMPEKTSVTSLEVKRVNFNLPQEDLKEDSFNNASSRNYPQPSSKT